MNIIIAIVRRASALVLTMLFGLVTPSSLGEETTKRICISSFGMNWATSEDAQSHLIVLAKREAVRELFGEMIWGSSEMKDSVVTRDELQSFSAGFVRVRGMPEFFNGTSLGETCVTAQFYLLQDDRARLQPRPVSKRVCVADPRLSLGEVRSLAERQAQVQAIRDFEPGLQDLDDEYVLRLLHEARITGAGFVPDTLTYCATVEGTIHPIELLAASRFKEGSKRNVTTPTPDSHVHVVFRGHTLDRAKAVAARLAALGYEVTTAESDAVSIHDWNRLYHHPSDKEVAIKIQTAVHELVMVRLLPSSDPNRSTFTLWVEK